ncbi:c-type cytochrome [Halarcobacter mediterraneus]|uniref:c-type cytochrome n=1 Tax=Halarcobacter mediterraneus TaxID=2023153 RepID=UPI001E477765|nr:c-type cytochrome [Halarcobacter mediterraneus]
MKIVLGSIITVLVFTGCMNSEQDESKSVQENKQEIVSKVENTKESETGLIEQVKDSTSKITQAVKEASKDVAGKVSEESKVLAEKGSAAVKDVEQKAQIVAKELTEEIVKKTKETKENIESSIEKIVETKKQNTSSIDPKSLYIKCAGCHGQNGQLQALGKSQVIKGWDKQKIKDALIGYKNGTYGAAMKGVMIAQMTSLNDEEIDALSEYIASF